MQTTPVESTIRDRQKHCQTNLWDYGLRQVIWKQDKLHRSELLAEYVQYI